MSYEYPEDDDFPVVELDEQDPVRQDFESKEKENYG